jgi:hypothetical protein
MQISSVSSLLGTISVLSQSHFTTGPLLYLYNCRTDPNENTNDEVVFSFWSVLRLLLGNYNNEVMFSFWSVPRLLPEEEEVLCYLRKKPSGYGEWHPRGTRATQCLGV